MRFGSLCKQLQSPAGLAGPTEKALQMARRVRNRWSGQHQFLGTHGNRLRYTVLEVRSVSG